MQPSFVIFSMIMVFACMMLLVLMAGPLAMVIKFAVRSCIGASRRFGQVDYDIC